MHILVVQTSAIRISDRDKSLCVHVHRLHADQCYRICCGVVLCKLYWSIGLGVRTAGGWLIVWNRRCPSGGHWWRRLWVTWWWERRLAKHWRTHIWRTIMMYFSSKYSSIPSIFFYSRFSLMHQKIKLSQQQYENLWGLESPGKCSYYYQYSPSHNSNVHPSTTLSPCFHILSRAVPCRVESPLMGSVLPLAQFEINNYYEYYYNQQVSNTIQKSLLLVMNTILLSRFTD